MVSSSKAAQRVGRATVEGKHDPRGYWSAAAGGITSIRFALDHIVRDDDRRGLVIVYDVEINGQKNRACEFLRFGADSRAVQREAMYGAGLQITRSIAVGAAAREDPVDHDSSLLAVVGEPYAPVTDAEPQFPCRTVQAFQITALGFSEPRECRNDPIGGLAVQPP